MLHFVHREQAGPRARACHHHPSCPCPSCRSCLPLLAAVPWPLSWQPPADGGGSGGILQDFSPAGWENCWVLPPMRKIPKPSPTASPLLFELDPEPLEETLTALGGIPLVVQAFRSLELPRSIQEQVRVKQRERGY